MLRIINFLAFVLVQFNLIAQKDSVERIAYSPDYKFQEGVYLNFEQVKNNSPISKSRIISSIDINDDQFFEVLLTKPVIAFYDVFGMKQEVKLKLIWGYSKNGVLYVRMNETFNRISYVGNICHFLANITVQQNQYDDPYYYNQYYYYRNLSPRNYTTNEMRQFIMDFDSGKIYDYNESSIEVLLMRDPELHDEYTGLSKRKKEQLKFFYIRKFNERNPLMLPANPGD
jgi:hypothetical protein